MDKELIHILTDIVSATHVPEKWPVICQSIVERTGATSFVIMDYDTEAARGSVVHMSDLLRKVAADMADEIVAGNAAEDSAIYEAAVKLGTYQIIPEWELLGAKSNKDLQSNAFRDELFRRTGAVTRQCVRFNDIGPFVEVGGLHTPYAEHVPGNVAADMAIIVPVIGKALEASRVIRRLVAANQALLDVFDLLDFGLALVRANGDVVLQNRSFTDLVQDRDGIAIQSGKLVGASSEDTRALRNSIQHAFNPVSPPGALTCTLSRKSGATPFVVKSAPIHERDFHKETCCLLLIIDPSDKAKLTASGLEAFGLLTKAELDVCERLLRGSGTEEIARQRNTSLQTARDQIKAASSKMSCRSRLDLLRLALASRPPIRTSGSYPSHGG